MRQMTRKKIDEVFERWVVDRPECEPVRDIVKSAFEAGLNAGMIWAKVADAIEDINEYPALYREVARMQEGDE